MKQLLGLFACLCLSVTGLCQYTLVKQDVNPASGSNPTLFTSFKHKTYFTANDGTLGNELWWSDGHSYGLAADINPGPANGFTSTEFCVAGDRLYFIASDSSHGKEIWQYDGSNSPAMIADLDSVLDTRAQLAALNGSLYFLARTDAMPDLKIYRYNPVLGLPHVVPAPAPVSTSHALMAFNGKLVYQVYGGSTAGNELYVYDPVTGQGTLTDINPGAASSAPGAFYVFKNVLFFTATTAASGCELYRYDGVSPPERITDILNGPVSSFTASSRKALDMAVYNGKLYFMARNSYAPGAYQLYSYEPQTGTITQIKQMNSEFPAYNMAVYGKNLFIACDSNFGQAGGLFVYDGSSVQNSSHVGFSTFAIPAYLTESNGRLFFSAPESGLFSGREVYVLTDSAALGIEDAPFTCSAVAYPNPATTAVTIDLFIKKATALDITLTDMQGRVVYTSRVKQYSAGRHEVIVPLQALAAGSYIYSIQDGEGKLLSAGKIMKE